MDICRHSARHREPNTIILTHTHQVRLAVRVVAEGLGAVVAVELPDEDEGEEDDDDEDDRHGDAHQDRRVVRVRADRLRPARLAELVQRRVRSDLEQNIFRSIKQNTVQQSNTGP